MRELIERLLRKNEDGSLAEITEADQRFAAEELQRLTQPVGVEPVEIPQNIQVALDITQAGGLYEEQQRGAWEIIADWFVRCHKELYSDATVARLIAERDDLIGARELNRCAIKNLQKERDALQEQVKSLWHSLREGRSIIRSSPHLNKYTRWDSRASIALTAAEPILQSIKDIPNES